MNLTDNKDVSLQEVQINGETYFRISNVDKMRPFFMSIVSDSNHWMFIGSNGGLTAGRKDAENALFPYYTDDKIIESVEHTGSKSIFLVHSGDTHVWEPFSVWGASRYTITRNLYKNLPGNKVLFEEINHDLRLTYQYQWNSCDSYGFIRKSRLQNDRGDAVRVTMLDGLQNILPYGVGSALQNQSSNLVDAYKRNELEKSGGIGIFGLSAIITDKAEPSEALKASIVWSLGLDHPTHLLSSLQLDAFRNQHALVDEKDIKGERGAYFVSKEISIPINDAAQWMIIADVNQSISSIRALSKEIQRNPNLEAEINEDIDHGTNSLLELTAAADAFQRSNDRLKDARHFSNALFNIMRGGIFDDNYQIEKSDLTEYLLQANREVAVSCKATLDQQPDQFSLATLKHIASTSGDPAVGRLLTEYLPLKFSRRHGDPSRPWNRFSINTRDENDGSKILDYEGNWRDIFQNWEALAHAYPEFLDGMIFRFLNASTFDGYNPYRITKHGIDWERIEADDPWSYIGYWGDHQLIYLLKFLELAESHCPGKLQGLFGEDLFVYANVPYKIKAYTDLLANPKDTIDFDHELDLEISQNRLSIGADATLLRDQNSRVVLVNFAEKILATVLAKMSNFIPEGGIWMNTQRPEWNDANNALVGNGVSVVTLCYLHRFLNFIDALFRASNTETVRISEELKVFLDNVIDALDQHQAVLAGPVDDQARKRILDGLGTAGSHYRQQIYSEAFNGNKQAVSMARLVRFTELCLRYTEHSVRANKRPDGLYHAYNLMSQSNEDEIAISHLDEMLEGQVAALSSGHLTSEESLHLLDTLKTSALFRKDQHSYLLYPDKPLPGLLEKNTIPAVLVAQSELLKKLAAAGNTTIIEKDVEGGYHFNGNFRNATDLRTALGDLSNTEYAALAEAETGKVLRIFEEVFNHKAFTGRSGTFFGYEGLGSIYWHMVSKLALAAQECCHRAMREQAGETLIGKMVEHYYEIVKGLGTHKPPGLYGAFPTDPYSHTPAHKGAQQPGMTGQVKEDILCRFGELGVEVREGSLGFFPRMLRKTECLSTPDKFNYIDVHSQWQKLEINEGSLCFTYCQIPIVYSKGPDDLLEVFLEDGTRLQFESLRLDADLSKKVFERSGAVTRIVANISETRLI